MSSRNPDSPGWNAREEARDSLADEKPGDQPFPRNAGWLKLERRLPENARIRRWMNLGDQALQNSDQETTHPVADVPEKGSPETPDLLEEKQKK